MWSSRYVLLNLNTKMIPIWRPNDPIYVIHVIDAFDIYFVIHDFCIFCTDLSLVSGKSVKPKIIHASAIAACIQKTYGLCIFQFQILRLQNYPRNQGCCCYAYRNFTLKRVSSVPICQYIHIFAGVCQVYALKYFYTELAGWIGLPGNYRCELIRFDIKSPYNSLSWYLFFLQRILNLL